ncbi:MAG: hypothetical protein JJ892_10580 [Balneola sp.]|nr:hypothetical protein [Balneola sp.]MBO6651009.1 hypothetical protein [Balneola sp.]MBO6711170.1 hypothetical protein [Balneola sp.]MBO6800715.1 hypothetical protein [Balneola sp.]MBO6869106.1 hypothetical protein [Balneola sp.]
MGTKAFLSSGFLSLIIFACTTNTTAQRKYALGIHAGTNGLGGSAIVRINSRINARVSYQGIQYDHQGTYNDLEVGVDYDGNADISSFSAVVDVYPFKRFFKISAGAFKMDWNGSALALPNEGYEIEGRVFEPDRLGSLTANITYTDKIVPYAGIGFGNALARGLPVKLNIDFGVVRSGAPIIDMEGTGMIAPTADNEAAFQAGLNEFEWYPIVRVGLSFAFIKTN